MKSEERKVVIYRIHMSLVKKNKGMFVRIKY
jgi:hypothetical protein